MEKEQKRIAEMPTISGIEATKIFLKDQKTSTVVAGLTALVSGASGTLGWKLATYGTDYDLAAGILGVVSGVSGFLSTFAAHDMYTDIKKFSSNPNEYMQNKHNMRIK